MKNFGGDFGGGFGKGPFGDYNGNGRYDPQDHWLNENYAGTDDEFDASDRNITGKGRRSHGKGRPSAYSPAAVIIAAGSCLQSAAPHYIICPHNHSVNLCRWQRHLQEFS